MKPKAYLSKEINNEELYQIVEDGMGLTEVKQVKKDLNTTEVYSEWSRYELVLNGKELTLNQRWNKDKLPIIIGLIILTFFIWIPLIFIVYKVWKEWNLGKEIVAKIGDKVNNI